jgi:hypothetical protein
VTSRLAMAPEPWRHWPPGGRLPALEARKRVHPWVLLWVLRPVEELFQLLGRFVDRRDRRLQGERLPKACGHGRAAQSFLP